jgi:hypothetical protein
VLREPLSILEVFVTRQSTMDGLPLRDVGQEPEPLEDREEAPKIQSSLNECMTFFDDEMSAIAFELEGPRGKWDKINRGERGAPARCRPC